MVAISDLRAADVCNHLDFCQVQQQHIYVLAGLVQLLDTAAG